MNRNNETIRHYLLAQSISITWTKRQRTSEHARLRATVPQVLPLPTHVPLPPGHIGLAGDIYYHVVQYAPENRYQTPYEQWKIATSHTLYPSKLAISHPRLGIPEITYTATVEGAQIQFDWAMTSRRQWQVNRLEERNLVVGQWLQLRLNARMTTWDDPYYTSYTLNISYVDHLTTNFFIDRVPTHEINDLQHLF